ncbi:MAG: Neuropathy target esterase, partial [Marteilia pararefringens]
MYLNTNKRFLDGALSNLKTIAVVSGSNNIPMKSFGQELNVRLQHYAKRSILLDSEKIKKSFNKNDIDSISSLKIMSHLRSLESQCDSLLMICDNSLSKWTTHVLEQADVIIVVLNFSDQNREPQGIESRIMSMKYKTSRILAFLHSNGTGIISGTNEWLKPRSGYHMHFHIRCQETFFQNDHHVYPDFDKFDHFSRLARHLTGNAIGFAFGGGGARGYSHVGIIREFYDRRVPTDIISGTSIGAFIGALFSIYENPDEIEKKTKEWSKFLSVKLNHLIDLSIPYISIFSGRQFSYILKQIFGSINIEDFWIPFYCITT